MGRPKRTRTKATMTIGSKKCFNKVDSSGKFVTKVIHPHQVDLSELIKREGDVVLLNDGDIIAYRSSAAADGREYGVTDSGVTQTFKYKKDAVEYCEKNKFDTEERISLVFKPEPVENAQSNCAKVIAKFDRVFKKELKPHGKKVTMETYLTPPVTFRDDVKSDYKANRKDLRRPANLQGCKDWLTDLHGAQTVDGYEADDLLSIRALQLWKEGKIPVIVTLDKDLDQVEGFHYNWVKNLLYFTKREESLRNLYVQLLMGDKTDNIPGIPRVGLITAKKILDECEDNSEIALYRTVLNAYIEKMPILQVIDQETDEERDETDEERFTRIIQMVTQNMRLLYLCRGFGDLWEPPVAAA